MNKIKALASDISTLSLACMHELIQQLVSESPDRAEQFEYILSTTIQNRQINLAKAKQRAIK